MNQADDFLLELFRGELETHTRVLEEVRVETAAGTIEPWMRAAHSIKGAARMVGVDAVVGLARAMEDVLAAAQHGKKQLTAGVVEALKEANGALAKLAGEGDVPAAAERERERLEELGRRVGDPPGGEKEVTTTDDPMADLFRTELDANTKTLADMRVETAAETIEPWMRAAHSIKGAARMVGVDAVVGLARAMEDVLAAAQHGKKQLTAGVVEALREANGALAKLACEGDVAGAAERQRAALEELARQVSAPGEVGRIGDPSQVEKSSSADLPMLDLFRVELETHARALEAGLVAAEGERAPEKIEPLMRASHSIKGAARMVGLDIAVELAHAMEDVLVGAQQGKWTLEARHVDLLLLATDCFTSLAKVNAPEIPASLEAQSADLKRMARSLRDMVSDPGASAPAPAPAVPQPVEAAPAQTERTEKEVVRVFAENLNRLMGLAGECLVQAKSVRPLSAALERIKQDQYGLSSELSHALEKMAEGDGHDLAGRLEEMRRRAEHLHGITLRYLAEFDQFTRRLERLSNRLYDEAVATRMRPFSDALHGYPRMVRDLARSLGKPARLEIEGAGTQVDRDILEKLEAPLTHLLRNALDHGIEPPEARAAAGKPAEGRLTLAARHVSGMLDITVADDGAGIEIEKLRRKVVAQGYAPGEMAASLTDAELLEFLFLPGFSTRSAVSEVSGRGVGLNIVQSMAREVGGSVRVETRPGAGTSFHLQLPLTLSVVRSLLLEIGGEMYAVPLVRLERVFRVARAEVKVVEDRQFCMLDGTNIGIVDATQALQLHAPPRGGDVLHIAVVSDHLNRYGLVVDRFAGERDLVVIPLNRRLGKIANISAGAILEDGSPVLILDVEDVVRSIDGLLTRGGLKKLRQSEEQSRTGRKRILVVDDSLTVREVERRLLENSGYEVSVAVDGVDGWNALRGGRFDLVITDVDMPRMDGIELVRRVRAWQPTASLPVVIVSYKEQEEYRMKGLDAGANAYLTKSSFHDAGLLNTVRDLVGEAH